MVVMTLEAGALLPSTTPAARVASRACGCLERRAPSMCRPQLELASSGPVSVKNKGGKKFPVQVKLAAGTLTVDADYRKQKTSGSAAFSFDLSRASVAKSSDCTMAVATSSQAFTLDCKNLKISLGQLTGSGGSNATAGDSMQVDLQLSSKSLQASANVQVGALRLTLADAERSVVRARQRPETCIRGARGASQPQAPVSPRCCLRQSGGPPPTRPRRPRPADRYARERLQGCLQPHQWFVREGHERKLLVPVQRRLPGRRHHVHSAVE